MPTSGYDAYQQLPGYDQLTWLDHLKIATTSDYATKGSQNPKLDYARTLAADRLRQQQEAMLLHQQELAKQQGQVIPPQVPAAAAANGQSPTELPLVP